MSDWHDKSKYEINKAVAKSYIRDEYIICNNDSQEIVYLCEQDGLFSMIPVAHYDPCTCIQDAWPIMKQYNIDIEWPDEAYNLCGKVIRYIEGNLHTQIEFTDKEEALRCAMIVYLESEGVHP